MVFRRILAAFFVFLFVIVSLPTFFVYAFSRTFFDAPFYSGPVSDKAYDYLVDTVTKDFYRQDLTLQRHFMEEDINRSVRGVFTPQLFRTIMADVGEQIEHLQSNPRQPVTVSFKVFRDSLLTVSRNISENLFQSLPVCKVEQLAEVNEEGIPTCIPKNIDYVVISGPLSKQFEKSAIASFSEKKEIDLTSAKGQSKDLLFSIFSGIDSSKLYLAVTLLFLIVLIAVLVYDHFSTLLFYEAVAFLISGVCGLLLSLSYRLFPLYLLEAYQKNNEGLPPLVNQSRLEDLLNYFFAFPQMETQKLAFIFLLLGAFLLGLRFSFRYLHFFSKSHTS